MIVKIVTLHARAADTSPDVLWVLDIHWVADEIAWVVGDIAWALSGIHSIQIGYGQLLPNFLLSIQRVKSRQKL